MEWFLGCLGRAIDGAQVTLSAVLGKARFWERIKGMQLNDRQGDKAIDPVLRRLGPFRELLELAQRRLDP
jgi:hypothetical protein